MPVPTAIDDSQIDSIALAKQEALERSCNGGNLMSDDDENDDDSEDDYSDDEGVPIPLINYHQLPLITPQPELAGCLSTLKPPNNSSVIMQKQQSGIDDEDRLKDENTMQPKQVDANQFSAQNDEREHEREVAQSLLCLRSGSWTSSENNSGKHEQECAAATSVQRKSPLQSGSDEPKRKVSILETQLCGSAGAPLWPQRSAQQHQHISEQFVNRPRSFSYGGRNDVSLRTNSHVVYPSRLSAAGYSASTSANRGQAHGGRTTLLGVPDVDPEYNKLACTAQPSTLGRPTPLDVIESSEEPQPAAKVEALDSEPFTETDDSEGESDADFGQRRYSMSVIQGNRTGSSQPWLHAGLSGRKDEQPMDLSRHPRGGSAGSDDVDVVGDEHDRQDYVPYGLPDGSEMNGEGKPMCKVCGKTYSKPSQLTLHMNIHYFERPFRCDACAVSFRSNGHLQKHKRSVAHSNKISMNRTFGTPTTNNPRPFKCDDCKIAFRIHGHLAKVRNACLSLCSP